MKRIWHALRVALALMPVLGGVQFASAEVRLPSLLGDNLVLQRQQPVPIWGWAEPGEEVTVAMRGQERKAVADADGKWRVAFDPMEAVAEPFAIEVKGTNSITLNNALVGEVWFCSGQSNMYMQVQNSAHYKETLEDAADPLLRQITFPMAASATPRDEAEGKWVESNTDSVGSFSGVAYYFARRLREETGVPVGLIHSSWGGTLIEPWISPAAIQTDPALERLRTTLATVEKDATDHSANYAEYRQIYIQRQNELPELHKKWVEETKRREAENLDPEPEPTLSRNAPGSHQLPGFLYNSMVHPATPYAIRGALWYQGESNTYNNVDIYEDLLVALVKSWRAAWGQNVWFLCVQLPNYHPLQTEPVEKSGWARVREAKRRAMARLDRAGLATTIDIGDAADIHPLNKRDVGIRLANIALAECYNVAGIAAHSPAMKSVKFDGAKARVIFEHADGLTTKDGKPPATFAIAGADKKWVFANAVLEGAEVVLSAEGVAEPVAVRLGWANNPPINLVNAAGLPATPFRTDDWEE